MNAAKRPRSVAFALLLSLVMIVAPGMARTALADDAYSYIEGQAIVGILEGDGLSIQSELPYDFEELMEVSTSAAGVQGASTGSLVAQGDARVRLELVTSSTLTTEELISELEQDQRVVFAEPNEIIVLPDTSSLEDDSAPQLSTSATSTPMSDLTGIQWSMWGEASYQYPESIPNPSVNSPAFGPLGRRGDNMGSEVIVAVLDMGIDYENPDLTDVVYRFSESEQQLLGCGEWGFNSMGDSPDGVPISLVKGADHGTHIAGILGASWDGHGISGVASNARIVNIQIGTVGRSTSLADSLRGFAFVKRANDIGINIRVTSSSWGLHRSTRAIDAAVRELGETYGVVCVFSAGNNMVDDALSEHSAASYADNPYAIVVAATDPNDELAAYSSFGETTVDIAAPGSYILSTVPMASATYLADAMADGGIIFEGFEGGDSNVTVSLTYYPQPEIDPDDWEPWSDEDIESSDLSEQAEAVETESRIVSAEEEAIEAAPEAEPEATPEESENLATFAGEGAVLTAPDGEEATEALTTSADEDEGEEQTSITVSGEISSTYRFNGSSSLYFPIDDPNPGGSFPIHIDVDLGPERMRQLAEEDELYLGFSCLVVGHPLMSPPDITTNVTGDAILSNIGNGTVTFESIWITSSYNLTENGPITPSEDGHLLIDVELTAYGDVTAVYLDSFGIGTTRTPYAFMDGTSMATPLVAGGAAVIASQSGAKGAELAALVRAHVRTPEAGALPVRTGGVLDLSAAVSDISAPKVTSASATDTSVTIEGFGFGGEPGAVTLSRYVVGRELEPIAATVSSWGDAEIVCTSDKPFSGILHVHVTNASSLTDSALVFISKGEEVYEQDLPFDASTDDPFVSEALGDFETKGPLVGLGCKLYYLPSHQFLEAVPAHNRMLVYDLKTNTWSQAPELPEWLSGVSACIYDGKLVVEGSTMYLNELGVWNDSWPDGEEAEERVYIFDPTTSTWSRASNEGMRLGQTIFNDAGTLKLIGGYDSGRDEEGTPIDIAYPLMSYDLGRGVTAELLSDIPLASINPSVAARNDTIVVYDQMAAVLMRICGDEAVDLRKGGIKYLYGGDDELFGDASRYTSDPYVCRGSVSPVEGGFILVGPPAKDGSSDTFFLADDADTLVSYPMRASEARVFSQTSTAYRGRLFVIGSSWVEPEKRLFRATAIDTVEYPGDIPCERDEPVDPVGPVEPTDPTSPTRPVTPSTQPSTKAATTLPKTSDIVASAAVPLAAGIIALVGAWLVRKNDSE